MARRRKGPMGGVGFLARLSLSRAFCLILLLGLLGCGSDSGTSTVTRTPPPPRGVVQSRTLADGTTHIAIGVAPHGPNFRTPDLSELRGQGIFDIVDKANGVRGRLKNDRTGLDALAGGQAVYVTDWHMRTEGRGIEFFGGENSGDRTNLDPARPLFGGFSSDGYLVYNAHLTTDEQAIAVTNGTIVGRADIRRTNIPHPNFPDSEIGLIEVSHNEGPFQPIIQDRPTASPNKYILSVVLPMESGSDPAGLGTWTVDAEPPIRLDPVNEPDNIVGGTPFSWHIRGLVIEDITVENKPNYVDPETGEEFHGGSIYTAKARMGPTAEPPEESLGAYNPTGRFYYRVKVLAGPAQYQVPILVDGGDFDPSGTELSFEWNGVNSGQRFPAGEKYPVSIWGVIDANGLSEPGDPNENPILTASGRVATPQNFVGPPELVPPRAYFTAFPNPYIPAPLDIDGDPLWFKFGDEYEPLWTHPETGDPWWPVVGMNDDGEVEYAFHPTVWEDGVEKEVDEDGDGFPDIGPQRPEPMKISGEMLFDPKKQELDEPWTIHVRKKTGGANGEDVHPVLSGNTNVIDKEISYEDMVRIVEEEGVNELHFDFHMKLCDLGQRELFFTARALEPNALPTPSGQCLLPIEVGVVAQVGEGEVEIELFHPPVVVGSSMANFPSSVPVGTNFSTMPGYNFFDIDRLGESNRVSIKVTDPEETGDTLDVEVRLSDSDPTGISVQLTRSSNAEDEFAGGFTLSRTEPTDDERDRLGLKRRPTDQHTYSYFDNTTAGTFEDDTIAFNQEAAALSEYRMGFSKQWPQSGKQYQVATPTSEQALSAAGYEDIIVTHKNTAAWARIVNQADTFYISTHGLHDAGSLTHGEQIPATHNKVIWSRNLTTAIVAGCSVCDIGNFNGWPKFKTNGSGTAWKSRLSDSGVLLGYNAAAPVAPNDVPIIREYYRLLSQFTQTQRDFPDRRATLWMIANTNIATRDAVFDADNACAITDDFYYFVKFETDLHNKKPTPTTQREIWRVHRNYWSSSGDSEFRKIPMGAQGRVKIRDLRDLN